MFDLTCNRDIRSFEYAVSWEADVKYLVVSVKGNIAGFYVDGKLLSDQFLNGDKWVIDVLNVEAHQCIVKVLPFREEDRGTVYLEVPFETGASFPKFMP